MDTDVAQQNSAGIREEGRVSTGPAGLASSSLALLFQLFLRGSLFSNQFLPI